MAEDLTLPRLAWDPSTGSILNNRPRKRARLSPLPSSDPPVFSSDDDPSADNYTQDRHKKIYRGPWYRLQPASESGSLHPDSNHDSQKPGSKKSKRTFERRFDSGVWLGSDGTDVTDGTDVDETTEGLGTFSGATTALPMRQSRAIRTFRTPQNFTLSAEEELAQREIELCLDDGNETIDLSSRELTSLSNATIRPLAAFTRVPPVTEGVFARIEPMLKIFLASNRLSKLPEELFNLEHLTVLSLRSNRIYELPPAIGRLRNLTELNISQNRLQYLPFEILDLFSDTSHLQSFQIHPNLFHEPQYPAVENSGTHPEEGEVAEETVSGNSTTPRHRATYGVSPDERQRTWHPQWRVSYRCRTEVRYLDINGAHIKGPTLSNHTLFGPRKFPSGIPIVGANDIPTPPTPRGNDISRVPSLLEVALNACSRTPHLPYLASELPEDCPESFSGLLALVAEKKESGGSKCTICKRNFIIPRTEWIEWWEITKAPENEGAASAASPRKPVENERDVIESMVPLIRRGCSWLCVPRNVALEGEGMDVDA